MKPSQLLLLRSLISKPSSSICNTCFIRQFHASRPLLQNPSPASKPSNIQPIHPPPKPTTKFELKPLGRPIGQTTPPHPNDNDPSDPRPWSQRRKDITNYERHLKRREELTRAVSRPYFRDWKGLDVAKGKAWLGNERLWRAESSLWMPNLRGRTLDKVQDKRGEGGLSSTTEVCTGKVSVVGVFSRSWGRGQCHSFLGPKENPEFAEMVREAGGVAQVVEVDVEDKPLMQWFQRLFAWNLRKSLNKEDWGKYFYLKELPESVREVIGVVNISAGNVYLVDKECKIRWAGSGPATEEEKAALVKGMKRLIAEKC